MDLFTSQQVLTLVPLTVGLVEALKAVGIPTRFAPVTAILVGIALACFVMPTIPMVILAGVAAGLMASGLYSGVRTMATGQ